MEDLAHTFDGQWKCIAIQEGTSKVAIFSSNNVPTMLRNKRDLRCKRLCILKTRLPQWYMCTAQSGFQYFHLTTVPI